MTKITSIIFDFDGVILDSVGLKSKIFYEVFKAYGEDVAIKSVDYHENNGGISRYEKFKYINKNFINSELNDEDFNLIAKKFKSLIKSNIYKVPFIKGSYEFIKNNYKNYKFYISTSTPHVEILEILKNKNLLDYFVDIYGAPQKKVDQINEILRSSSNSKNSFIFIGDSNEDYEASLKNNIKFIGVKSRFTKFNNVILVDNLVNLENYLV